MHLTGFFGEVLPIRRASGSYPVPNTGYFIQQITRRDAGTCLMHASKKDKAVIFTVNKATVSRWDEASLSFGWTLARDIECIFMQQHHCCQLFLRRCSFSATVFPCQRRYHTRSRYIRQRKAGRPEPNHGTLNRHGLTGATTEKGHYEQSISTV